jgi:hypothetical protein
MSDLFHEKVPAGFVARVWKVMEKTPQHTYQILTKRPDRMAEVLSGPEFKVLPNVWLGASVEDSKVLGRLHELREVPAAVRFVSFEPLIGSVAKADLTDIHWAIVGGESGPRSRYMDPTWVDEIERLCRRAVITSRLKNSAGPTSLAASIRIFSRGVPGCARSNRLCAFSIITMAASIIAPTAIAIPPRLMMLDPSPIAFIAAKLIKMPTGSIRMATSALRKCNRKTKHTIATTTLSSINVCLSDIENVKKRLTEIAPSLPAGTQIVPVYDRSELIKAAIETSA